MYLGDSPYEVQVGDRRVKAVDPWRAGLMCAFVPFYGLYWWYRTASDLRALGDETRNDNARLNPLLIIVLVLLGGALAPFVAALVLLTQAIAAGQRNARGTARISPIAVALLFLATWAAGPVAIVLIAAAGASGGGLVIGVVFALVFSAELTAVLYEQLQFELNSIWSTRRPLAPAHSPVPQPTAA